MKLYVMVNGIATGMPREALVSSGAPLDPNDVVSIPTTTYLIDHPDGLVLYDTGWTQRSPHKGAIHSEKNIVDCLAKLGVRPSDIKYVICSHLHLDHAGCLEFFKDSVILVSESEFTNVAKLYMLDQLGPHYVKKDIEEWIRIGLKWRLIGDEGKVVDFLDGIKILSYGPGHSFGMLALLVQLSKTGNVILTSDAIYCRRNLGPPIRLPGVIRDSEGCEQIIKNLIQRAQDYNAQLWYGHDMEQFKALKKFDQGYYE
ncbi:MAG: N-acyl homoserine lactonase family protein [Peptococcaceae bacterium]|nr:N-acyl homoserine lactonase family protein [Peptococcaceae bacterium]